MLPTLRKSNESVWPLFRIQRDIDRLFEGVLGGELPVPTREGNGEDPAFIPPVDVRETDDTIIVETEIPGIGAKDIGVQVQGDVLSIRGERKCQEETQTKAYLRRECSFGRFERRIELPSPVEADKVEATAYDGMLRITLPKQAGAKARTVSVKVRG